MDMDMANMIAAALAKLPQRVIWKYLGEEKPATLGNNTMAVPWISQQDLIGRLTCRVVITYFVGSSWNHPHFNHEQVVLISF